MLKSENVLSPQMRRHLEALEQVERWCKAATAPYADGYDAACAETWASRGWDRVHDARPLLVSCPYPRGSEEADAWHRGYADARREMRSEAF